MAGTLHPQLTQRASRWISKRCTGAGFNHATEVFLGPNYVADAVVIASLQHRFWLAAGGGEQHSLPERLVIVFETKVSRTDFLATFNSARTGNRRFPIGNLHYIITPPALHSLDHLPPWWGLLQQSYRGLQEIRPAQLCPIDEHQLHHAAFRVLLASQPVAIHRDSFSHDPELPAYSPGNNHCH